MAIERAPLEGTDRVEDTANPLAHPARNVIACTSEALKYLSDRLSHHPYSRACSSRNRVLERELNAALERNRVLEGLLESRDGVSSAQRRDGPGLRARASWR